MRMNWNRVAVVPDDATKTAGGLYVPQTVDQDVVMGTIVSSPAGWALGGAVITFPFNEGDKVCFSQMGATKATVEGKPVLIVRCEDVFCQVE